MGTQNVTFLSTVDELSCVHAFCSNECFGLQLVSVWVSEYNFSEWCTTTGIVQYVLKQSNQIHEIFARVGT